MTFLKKQNTVLGGEVYIFGDRIITIFALILASVANGKTKITGAIKSKNILNLVENLRQLGINIVEEGADFIVDGGGLSGLREPDDIINTGSSRTVLYMLMALLSSYNFRLFFSGSDVLRGVSLGEILEPLRESGVSLNVREGNRLPLLMDGNANAKAIRHELHHMNARLKDAMILSGLNRQGTTLVAEKQKSSSHLEILLKYLGVEFIEKDVESISLFGNRAIMGKELSLAGRQEISAKNITVPADISFAAFVIAIAMIQVGSNLVIKGVCVNHLRDAFCRTIIDMGANIEFINQKIVCGEKIADIHITSGALRDTIIPASRICRMMNEYPVLFLIAAASGRTMEFQGMDYLEENDGVALEKTLRFLKDLGANMENKGDRLIIGGGIGRPVSPVETYYMRESKLLLTALVGGLCTDGGVGVNEDLISAEYPGIVNFLRNLQLDVG